MYQIITPRPGLTGQEDKMKKSARTPSFGLHNSTDKWVLIVDDYFGYFDSQEERDFYHKKASDQFVLYHGCLNKLEPNESVKYNIDGEPSEDIVTYQPIDIIGYIKTKRVRTRTRLSRKICDKLALNNLPLRFVYYKRRDVKLFDFDNLDLRPVDEIWRSTVHGVNFDKYNYNED